jgi:hypothetical protein
MISGSAALHTHHIGLLMMRGISCNGHFGQAKQFVINAVAANCLFSVDDVMPNIIHISQNV